MKKIIASLALIGALSIVQTSVYKANIDNPNEKVNYKKTQVNQSIDNSETSILVDDTITPSCKCEDGKCQKDKKVENEKDSKKQISPKESEKTN
ncbi:MAG: hypothetical protein ACRC68_04185 [Clostridium sp.]